MTSTSTLPRRGLAPPLRSGRLRAARAVVDRRHPSLALLLYALGAVVTQRHAVAHLGSVIEGNGVGDPTQYMWAMWWWPHAILSGLNPFVTHAIWVPNAYNLGSVTSTPLPALLLSPITFLAGSVQGPIVSYNLANLIAPVLGAWFAYRLCLYLTRSPGPAIVGGWLFGFSSYALSTLEGHLHLVFTFAPPAMVLLLLQHFHGAISRRRLIVLLALVLSCQVGCGTEVLFTMTVMAVVLLICALILAPSADRRRVLALIPPAIVAYALMAVVCAPFLYYALTGPAVVPGLGVEDPADSLSFVIPTAITWLGGRAFVSVSGSFQSNLSELGTYLGLPLIAIVIAYWRQAWRLRWTKVLAAVTAISFAWSLGEYLTIDGHTTMTLPWKWLAGYPGFNEVMPGRIGLYTALAASVAAALWLAAPRAVRPGRWFVALLAVAFIFPNADGVLPGTSTPVYREAYRSPPFITAGIYKRYLPRDTVVLPIPFGPFGTSLLWQAQARGWFRLASGWFGFWPAGYSDSMVVGQMSGFHAFTDPVGLMAEFLTAHRVGAVVMVPAQAGPWPAVMARLGLRPETVGGVMLYRVPPALNGTA